MKWRMIIVAVVVLLAIGFAGVLSPTASAEECGLVYHPPTSNRVDYYEWHWCLPKLPQVHINAPDIRWPGRPPLADKNSAVCTQKWIWSHYSPGTGYASGWWRTGIYKVQKSWWPDYYHITFTHYVTWKLSSGLWTGWNIPDWTVQRTIEYDCDA